MHARANQGNVFSSSFFSLLFRRIVDHLHLRVCFLEARFPIWDLHDVQLPTKRRGRSIDAGQQEDISHPSRSLIGKKKKRKQQKDKVEKMIIEEQM